MKEQKLRQLIREKTKEIIEEEGTPDGEHAKNKLREVNKFSKMILGILRDDQEVPNWVMDKLVLAADNMNEIYQYMENQRID